MMWSQILLTAFFILYACGASSGGYAGLTLGRSNVEHYSIDEVLVTEFSLGYRFYPCLAVEGAYVYFDNSALNGEEVWGGGRTATVQSAKFHMGGLNLSVIGILPLNDVFELYGASGMYLWESTLTWRGGTESGQARHEGSDLNFRLGASWHMLESVSVNLEFARYTFLGAAENTAMSAGIVYSF